MFTQDPTLDEIYFNGNHAIGMLHGMTTTTHPCPVIEAQDWLRQLQEFSMSQHHLLTPRQPSAGGFLHNHDLRWQAAIPPLAPPSGMLILRKHRFAQLNLADFALDRTHQEQIRTALERKQPLLIFGSTGVGKTSLLATILKYWAPVERTFVLENLQEFPLLHPLYARLQPGPQYDYKATLQTLVRCRPERIIFGDLPPAQAEIF
ncbi:MAG: ATPase, T2SS/T4P/T4SS family, partial [Zetaproteobacteria bacterium]|nr:ATPase, T2SS/T4P/T4SS family [Zetaproteobacteria bacterium]